MNLRSIFLSAAVAMVATPAAFAQTTFDEMAADLNRTGGVYYAYPNTTADNTPAPKGYKPFYISHYGRHGSRYLGSDNDYQWMYKLMNKAKEAGALTPVGLDMLARLDTVMAEADKRGGDLSPLGVRQHKGIAARMYQNYPEVFKGNAKVSAKSTLVVRCVLSMASFCESLKELNPKMQVDMESSQRNMYYLCSSCKESDDFNNDWVQSMLKKFRAEKVKPERMVKAVFSDPEFVTRYVDLSDFMWGVYWIASDAQNSENKISFYDFFTPEELVNIWKCFNADFYSRHSNYPPAQGKHMANAKPLLRNFLQGAEDAIAGRGESATLRFGHDGNVVPFVALLHFKDCYGEASNPEDFHKVWCDWKVSPMGANIQMVFFRNDKKPGDILVKFLHNERETSIPVKTDLYPYYHWADVKDYYESLLK